MVWQQLEDHRMNKKAFSYKNLTLEEEIKKITEAKSGNRKAEEEIVLAHIKLAATHAAKYRNYGLPYADLFQSACVGICRAIQKFDPNMNARFATYAELWIRAEIYLYVTENWTIVKKTNSKNCRALFFKINSLTTIAIKKLREIGYVDPSHWEIIHQITQDNPEFKAEQLEEMYNIMNFKPMSMDTPIASPDGEGSSMTIGDTIVDIRPGQYEVLEEKMINSIIKREVKTVVEKLREQNPRSADILCHRHLSSNPLTLKDLSEKYSVSRERIRQIEQKSLEFVQQNLDDVHHLLQ